MSDRLLVSAEGSSEAAFDSRDWALLTVICMTWGSSFLLMAIGLDHLEPSVVTFGRIGFGALTLNLLPAARHRFGHADNRRLMVLAVTWIALPLSLFPIAQQWIDSSVAGMLNAATPALTAIVATLLLRRLPGARQRVGILLGFAGVALISWPNLDTGQTALAGIGLVLLATCCYAISINLVTPIQQRHGSLPVLARVQAIATVLVAVPGIAGMRDSEADIGSIGAVFLLGVAGTGLAYVAMGTLIGHVGGTRASIVTYLIPVVAVSLGVALRDEPLHLLAVVGCGLVLVSAYISSRSGR